MILHALADDSMKGRGNGRPELLKAGLYIGDRFEKAGLQPLPGFISFYIPFRPFGGSKKIVPDRLVWNEKELQAKQYRLLNPEPGVYRTRSMADFQLIKLDSLITDSVLLVFDHIDDDLLIWSDRPGATVPDKLKIPGRGLKRIRLLACSPDTPNTLTLTANAKYYSGLAYNVVATLPAEGNSGQSVLFSAHYDHEGVYAGKRRKDSIMNGANDNATGTTALVMLAEYFAGKKGNERSLIFCAFSGEELGLIGSTELVKQVDVEPIVAGINLEMLGIPQFGANTVFITGRGHSGLYPYLKEELEKNGIQVVPEPDPEEKQLFSRSDNYPFVEKGVPAHTIMAGDDSDECYHQPCDEIERIDIVNLVRLVRAIAAASGRLISGEITPSR